MVGADHPADHPLFRPVVAQRFIRDSRFRLGIVDRAELLWPLPLTMAGFTLFFTGVVLMRMRAELARNRTEARLRRSAMQ